MSLLRRSFSAGIVGALAVSTMSGGVTAAEKPEPPAQLSTVRPTMAAGLIVKTTTSTASSALVRAADRALPSGIDVTRVRKSASGGRTSVLPTSRRLTAAEAETATAELRKRSDVVWAAPNYILRAFTDPPVPASDSYFVSDKARQVWDWRSSANSTVRSVMGSPNSFGNGGYSSRAPYAWRATRGAGAVVAVLDTGITAHPDLPTWNGTTASERILPGYDFVSQYKFVDGTLEDTGRDDDGWDSNPQDEGDWERANDCYPGSSRSNSSWHGTHVAGILAATKDNGSGVVGVAPEAEILPVRVLGLCGGTIDDFGAAMKWSVGLPVTNPLTDMPVPINARPADVINMSLGAYTSCTSDNAAPMREAISAVRATGAVVVAAVGNDGVNIADHPVVPASCKDVLSVAATSEYGDRAGYRNSLGKKSAYSNYGNPVDVSAPGGDAFWSSSGGIVSTINSGTTTPVSSAYARYMGTSMATPVVSAAAALLKSVNGDLMAEEVDRAIRGSVRSFPGRRYGSSDYFLPCFTSGCGTGILDLSKIQVPLSKPTILGEPIIGEPLTVTSGSWLRTPTEFTYEWFRDGASFYNKNGATYYPTRADVGKEISVSLRPDNEEFRGFASVSAPTSPVPDGPDVAVTGLPSEVKYGVGATATVTVSSDGSPVDGEVELRRGDKVLARQAITGGTAEIAIEGTKWVAGSNLIRAAFVANETTPTASSAGTPVTVTKASSVVSTTLPTSVRYTSRATIGITVKVDGVPAPTGQLRIYDGSKKIVYAVLASSAGGKRSIVLPRLSKGYHYIKVVYSGSSVISGDTSTTRRIKSY